MAREDAVRAQRERIEAGIDAVRRAAAEDAVRIQERLAQPGQSVRVVGMPPPPPIELFRGRQTELEILADHLSTPGVRIIAIIGKPGMGKTALARKLLQDLEEGRSYGEGGAQLDGVVYLSTRTAGISFERIYFDCAQLLGGEVEQDLIEYWNQRHATATKASKLLSRMREGSYVVLLDNLEDQLDSEGRIRDEDLTQFFDVLRARETTDSARVLITSRATLAVPTDAGDYHRGLPLDGGLELEKCVEVLRGFDPDGRLGLSAASSLQLEALARAVGGAPRGLELVASLLMRGGRLDEVTALAEAASGTGDTGAVPGLAERNHRLMSQDARRVLEALAVLGRPVPVVALDFLLEPTCPGMDVPKVVEDLLREHAASGETLKAPHPSAASAVVSLHPADHDIVLAHLDADSARRLHHRAAAYYARLRLDKPWNRIRQLEPQLLEVGHHLKADDFAGAADVMDSIDYSWTNHHKYLAHLMYLGYGHHSIDTRQRLLAHLGASTRGVHNRVSLGWVCRRMGRKREAGEHLARAAEVARTGEDAVARVYALSELGYYLTDNAGQHDEAEAQLTVALAAARSAGDVYGQAHAALGLAFADFQRGENAGALRNTEEALRLFQQVDTPLAWYREVDCWVRLGMIYRKTGNYARALDTVGQGLEVARKHEMADWEAELHSGRGFHLRALGSFAEAAADHERALTLFKVRRGMRREEAVQYSYLANVLTDIGRFDEARRHYAEAERIARSVELRRELSWILGNSGVLSCRLGDTGTARLLQEEALRIVEENAHLDSKAVRCTDLAATYLAMRDPSRVEQFVMQALESGAKDEGRGVCGSLPEAYVKGRSLEDKLPHEMQSVGDHQRRGALLARAYLMSDRLEDALSVVEAARASRVANPHQHRLAALEALALMRQGRLAHAEPHLRQAIALAEAALERARAFYSARYSVAFAHAGLAVLNTGGCGHDSLQVALGAYEEALGTCSAAGVVDEAGAWLDELAKVDQAGVLAPVRERVAAAASR